MKVVREDERWERNGRRDYEKGGRERKLTWNWNSSFPSAHALPVGGKPKRTLTSIIYQSARQFGDEWAEGVKGTTR